MAGPISSNVIIHAKRSGEPLVLAGIYITSFYMCHDSLISNVKNSSQYMCAGMHVSSQVLQVTIVKLDAIRAMRIRTNPSNTS